MRFLQLGSVEIGIYSEDEQANTAALSRPVIEFSESIDLFSPTTFYSIYDSYGLNSEIRNSLEEL